jgi:hypothetical protein
MMNSEETKAAYPNLDLELLRPSCSALVARLQQLRAKRVFVQYVAQGFQPRGCPLWFLKGLRRWREASPDARLVIMFQELWFEPPFWKPDWLLQKLHRRALCNLAGVVDRTFVSTESFRRWLKRFVPPDRLSVLMNPATVSLARWGGEEARESGVFVLFGRQGSRLFALRDMAPWLKKLHAGGILRKLWLVGSQETAAMNARETELAGTLLPEGAAEILGPHSAESLSLIFRRAEAGIYTKTACDYTKSTIFMGYASHGLGIVSQERIQDSAPPLCWVTHPSELVAGSVSMEQLHQRGRLLSMWYEENASWERVSASYRKALGVS